MTDLGILRTIGDTPVVDLTSLLGGGRHARVLAKLESHNPTGSLKDRMALAVVERAIASGDLVPNGRLVEYSGGSTGTSLAFVCAAHGHRAVVVSSDAFSREKLDHMRALGAEVIVIKSDGGRITRELIGAMMARAEQLASEPGSFYADQFNNTDATDGYAPLAQELWRQAGARVDVFVHAVGTAHSLTGVGRELRKLNPGVVVVAVEPAESPVLSGGDPGGHQIEGIGPGFVPPIWRPSTADHVAAVSTKNAMAMSRKLAKDLAVFAGTSSGANVVAALEQAVKLGPDATVATIVCDSGMKYLSTALYSDG